MNSNQSCISCQNKHHFWRRSKIISATVPAWWSQRILSFLLVHLRNLQVLTLPSVNCLGKITRTFYPDVTVINSVYLTKRHSKLMQYQTYVSLSFDEIYIANRLEYSPAQKAIIGLTDSGDRSRTVLLFIINSIAGGYRDVVLMVWLLSRHQQVWSHSSKRTHIQCGSETMGIVHHVGEKARSV